MELRGRKVIAVGDRDGVQGGAIAKCVVAAGGEVLIALTDCAV